MNNDNCNEYHSMLNGYQHQNNKLENNSIYTYWNKLTNIIKIKWFISTS